MKLEIVDYWNEMKKVVLLEISLSKIEFTEDEIIFLYSLFSLFRIDDKKLKRAYNGKILDIFSEFKIKIKNIIYLKK